MSGTEAVCENCGQMIGPSEEAVRAVHLTDAGSNDGVRVYLEGIGSFFHSHHYADGGHWREKARGLMSELASD